MNATALSKTVSHIIPQTIRSSLSWNLYSPNPRFSPKPPSFLATNLLKSYFDKGLIREARTLFDEMPERDVVAWTAMISGYTSCNLYPCAWVIFYEMMRDTSVHPNEFTFSSTLKACKGMKSPSCGALVHGLVIKHGKHESMYVANALLDVYSTLSASMKDACMVFSEISEKNDVSWTTMIAGYTHRGDGYCGLQAFKQMLLEGVEPNAFSFSIAIKACALISPFSNGRHLHAAVIKHGFDFNIPVMNSILDMYCRGDDLNEANHCFHCMPQRDIITWNTLIAGYEKSNPKESINFYLLLELEGPSPNTFTFSSIIAAVANLAALSCGEQVHGRIIQRGLGWNLELANALIDMYAKCGNIASSRRIFNEMPTKNLVSWTSMMIGYGSHGNGKQATELFDDMVGSSLRPDRIAFMAVLNACSHAGLVDEGLKYFSSMVDDYNIVPDQEIYGCVVDLLGRAGRVKEAYQLIEKMPFSPDESVWGAYLGACLAHKLPDLGTLAVREVLGLKPKIAGTYLMLSKIYAANGEWKGYAKMRNMMTNLSTKKEVGRSWVEVRNEVNDFVAGDK
ncbi:putative pentatricopeptide repeat-containing protein At1g56570 [Ipomoea triloba]|uniref:putative pentatricopeptide repeat-containing protein At1g56570 n=1 Tax=Ipomoea triloba TaxID=35885 RepID=UPI00125E4C85|nr:putative pentatricopeptide repeat-containing protein At1g56570 [Ipomoea triloba]XP_031130318.1 putative pentatricopeptide repeat-containing protein At1g56570 [Ipomoea triloba]